MPLHAFVKSPSLALLWAAMSQPAEINISRRERTILETSCPSSIPYCNLAGTNLSPISNLHLLSGMMGAVCKSLVFPFAGRKLRKQMARLRQNQPRLGRDQADCFYSQIRRCLPKEKRTLWSRRASVIQWPKAPGNLELYALPQAWKCLHASDAAQPLREAKGCVENGILNTKDTY